MNRYIDVGFKKKYNFAITYCFFFLVLLCDLNCPLIKTAFKNAMKLPLGLLQTKTIKNCNNDDPQSRYVKTQVT